MRIKNLFKKLEFWTLVVVVLGGVCNYFFVTRFTAIHDEANARYTVMQVRRMESSTLKRHDELSNAVKEAEISLHGANERLIEKTIERFDSRMAKLSEVLVHAEKRAKISLEIGTYVKDMQPNLQIDSGRRTTFENGTLTFDFDIKNLGNHTSIIDEPAIHVSRQPIYSPRDLKGFLTPGKEYDLQNMRIGNVPSGQSVKHIFRIMFKDQFNVPPVLYFYVEFQSSTDWAIRKLAQKLLIDYLNSDEIDTLSQRTYSRWGSVVVGTYLNER